MPSRTRGGSSVEGETGQGTDGAAEDDDRESGGDTRPVCALEMDMTNRNLQGDSKVDSVNCDGLINRNGGDTTEISVPLSFPLKRITPIEGDNLYRLRDRKFLLEDKKRLCAWALGTALLGILLMIIHAEMCPFVYQPVSLLKLITTAYDKMN